MSPLLIVDGVLAQGRDDLRDIGVLNGVLNGVLVMSGDLNGVEGDLNELDRGDLNGVLFGFLEAFSNSFPLRFTGVDGSKGSIIGISAIIGTCARVKYSDPSLLRSRVALDKPYRF